MPYGKQDDEQGDALNDGEAAEGAPTPSEILGAAREGAARGARRLIAVGGGRGGVGKSLVAVNLAVYFAQLGKRVVLVDADASGANLHTHFGLRAATREVPIDEDPEALTAALAKTSVPGLELLPAPLDALGPTQALRGGRKARWLAAIRALPAEYLVVDVGPGHGPFALDAMLVADVPIVVTVPEPPAIEATYRFLRVAYRTRLRRALGNDRFRLKLLERALTEIGAIPSPVELIAVLARMDRSLAEIAWAEAHRLRLNLVVNQTRVRTDIELGAWMSGLARRHYGALLDELGHIEHDDTVWLTVRRNKPLLVDSPTSKAARNLERIARRVVALLTTRDARPAERGPLSTEAPTLYAVLGITRSSNDEEIRRAYKRQREIYATGGIAVSSLLADEDLRRAQARLDEAYDTLLDPVRRRAYDLSTFAEAEPETLVLQAKPALAAEQLLLQSELAREIGPDTEFSGELLRKVRESQGLELSEISARTKIARSHLAAIEEEQFDLLPAQVYVRGFITELAKVLRLDPPQVQKTYLRRMRESGVGSRGRM
jgi:flagellar biosynthesis protein FlhG